MARNGGAMIRFTRHVPKTTMDKRDLWCLARHMLGLARVRSGELRAAYVAQAMWYRAAAKRAAT